MTNERFLSTSTDQTIRRDVSVWNINLGTGHVVDLAQNSAFVHWHDGSGYSMVPQAILTVIADPTFTRRPRSLEDINAGRDLAWRIGVALLFVTGVTVALVSLFGAGR